MNKKTVISSDKLIRTRKENLLQMHSYSLCANGKWWGMDIFSWCNPEIEMLSNTIHSFPFKVIWIGNECLIRELLMLDPKLSSNLKALILYDSKEDSRLENQDIPVYLENTLFNAFNTVMEIKESKVICLFTASSPNWKEDKTQFDHFLSVVKI